MCQHVPVSMNIYGNKSRFNFIRFLYLFTVTNYTIIKKEEDSKRKRGWERIR